MEVEGRARGDSGKGTTGVGAVLRGALRGVEGQGGKGGALL